MTSSVTLRQATPSDFELLKQMSRELNTHEQIPFTDEKNGPPIKELLDTPSIGRAFLLDLEGKVVGYSLLTFGFDVEYHGRDAFITELFVRPQFRGGGVGTRALELVMEEAKKLKVAAVHLEVRLDNES